MTRAKRPQRSTAVLQDTMNEDDLRGPVEKAGIGARDVKAAKRLCRS
jgi:hypothetical protein